MKKAIKYGLLSAGMLAPVLSFAALSGVKSLTTDIGVIVSSVTPIIMTLAFIYFFWGIAQFVLKDAGNDKTREDGKKKILWGIVAIFVMVSITGIVHWIGSTLDIPVTGDSSFGTVNCNTNPNQPPC